MFRVMARTPLGGSQRPTWRIGIFALLVLSGGVLSALLPVTPTDSRSGPCVASADPTNAAMLVVPELHAAPLQLGPVQPAASEIPELPRAIVTLPATIEGKDTVRVRPRDDLQAAISAAQPGTVLLLTPGASYKGNFVLCAKPAERSGWITIMADPAAVSLPRAGTRLTPGIAQRLPKLIARDPHSPVIRTELGAHHYRLVGLEITAPAGQTSAGDLIRLGSGSTDQDAVEKVAHDLILDRVYVHGTATLNFKRCVALNSAATAIVDSWLSECHGAGLETQAIGGWNGPGPFRIENNHLEGSGMGLMFGGATPAIVGLHPADIVIRRNHFTRPLSWQGTWSVKNLLELKHAQRVLIEGNVFENNWADAQTGFALVWKSSAALTGAEWTLTSDITFRHNIVRNSAGGLNLAAAPDGPAQPARRILVEQNLFENIGSPDGGGAILFQVLGALSDVKFVHNTALFTGGGKLLLSFDGRPMRNFGFHDNVATLGAYGIKASGKAVGTASLNAFVPGSYSVSGNLFIGSAMANRYPPGNRFVPSIAAVGFVHPESGDFMLAPSSTAIGAGADMAVITEATRGVTDSVAHPAPDLSP
jgi:hypothetical protein